MWACAIEVHTGTAHDDTAKEVSMSSRHVSTGLAIMGIALSTVVGTAKAGKGCAVSIGVNLWFLAHPQSKIILTSQRFRRTHFRKGLT